MKERGQKPPHGCLKTAHKLSKAKQGCPLKLIVLIAACEINKIRMWVNNE